MSKINDGGSAFPTPHLIAMNGEVVNIGATGGMTLRDYFAIHASEGDIGLLISEMYEKEPRRTKAEIRAEARYAFADALIREGEKGNTNV